MQGEDEVTLREPQGSYRCQKSAPLTFPVPSGCSQADPRVIMQKKSSVLGLAPCYKSCLELPLACYSVRKFHITGLCCQEMYNLLRR